MGELLQRLIDLRAQLDIKEIEVENTMYPMGTGTILSIDVSTSDGYANRQCHIDTPNKEVENIIWSAIEELESESSPQKEEEELGIIVTARQILQKTGAWDKFCDMKGLNPWCVNEGRMDSGEEFRLTKSEAKELGFL